MSTLPPAGWFDDPENLGFLRYWDGAQWTEHRSPHGSSSPSTLSDVGTWLNQSFADLWTLKAPLAALGAMLLAAWASAGAAVSWAVNDLAYFDDAWHGVDGGRIATAALVVALVVLLSLVLYLAAIHQLHTSRVGDAPSLAQSMSAGLRAAPRAIGWTLLLSLGALAVFGVIGVVVAVVGPIGFLLFFAVLFGGAWVWVKLSFLFVACVAPQEGLSALKASAEVSKGGRFWAVLGRVLLLTVIGAVIAFALGLPLSTVGGGTGDLDQILVTDDSGGLVLFHVGNFVDEIGLGGGALILLTSLPQVLTSLLTLSGTTNLYAQVHRRRAG